VTAARRSLSCGMLLAVLGAACVLSLAATPALAQSVPGTSKVAPPKPKPKPESKPETRPDTKPKDEPSARPDGKADGKSGGKTGEKPDAAGAGLEFTGEKVRIESVGFAMELPASCRAESNGVAGNPAIQITPADGTWIINATVQRSGSGGTLKEIADAMSQQATGAQLNPAQLMDRVSNLSIGGQPAERFYLKRPSIEASKPALISGYTIFEPLKGQFVVIDVTAGEPLWTKARPAYETLVATATFEDPKLIEQGRRIAVEAGIKLMADVSPAVLAEVVGTSKKERWERMAVPATSGAKGDDQELGYRRITTWMGKRGEMELGRDRARMSGSDLDEGALVQIQARLLLPSTKVSGQASGQRAVIDVFSSFFMAKDRASEAWVVKMTQRDGAKAVTSTETGARVGDQMTVRIDDPSGATRNLDPVVRSKIPIEFGFYAYQSELSRIALRTDVLEAAKDAPGMWRLTTKLHPDAKPQIMTLNERGEVVRTVLADGSEWTATTLDELRRLWQSKGLPLD
jgi:hypothetical protein